MKGCLHAAAGERDAERASGRATEMTEIGKSDVERLAPAWRELETRSPVKLRAVENDRGTAGAR